MIPHFLGKKLNTPSYTTVYFLSKWTLNEKKIAISKFYETLSKYVVANSMIPPDIKFIKNNRMFSKIKIDDSGDPLCKECPINKGTLESFVWSSLN